MPSNLPPANQYANPDIDNGWHAWWPAPPPPGTQEYDRYEFQSPPKIDPPIVPTKTAPFCYKVKARIGDQRWGVPELHAIRMDADARDQLGNESILSYNEVSATRTSVMVRAFNILTEYNDSDIPLAKWNMKLNGIDRDIVSAILSEDRR